MKDLRDPPPSGTAPPAQPPQVNYTGRYLPRDVDSMHIMWDKNNTLCEIKSMHRKHFFDKFSDQVTPATVSHRTTPVATWSEPYRYIQFKNNYFAEMWSGSEEGSFLEAHRLLYHSTLGSREIKKKR